MKKPSNKKLSPNQKYKKSIKKLIRQAQSGDEASREKVIYECEKNALARWVVKHLQKFKLKMLKTKSSLIKKAKVEKLSSEQEALRLRVQSSGFGDGAHVPHSRITKYGKDNKRK